jgi:RNA polymerase sigma factor (sigma-70 family)
LTHPEQAAAQAVQAVAPRQLDPLTIPLAPSEGYVDFFRDHYPELVKAARYAGATREEAEDATSKTLDEMYWKWPIPGSPLRYARKAVINNFIKAKTRGNLRVARRLIERGHVARDEALEDERLTDLENSQWVTDVLSYLSPGQRDVMQLLADGLSREEIAQALGKSADAVRRHLCDARPRLAELLNPDGEYRSQTARTSREEAR